VKITLTSEESVRLEPAAGPMTIEAPSPEQQYSPFHMLGSSLAYCTYSILASWASNAGIASDDIVVDVAWSFAEKPHRVGEMRVTFDWPALPAERRAAAQRVAKLCTVHATLSHSPTLTVAAAGAAAIAAPVAPVAPVAPRADALVERAAVAPRADGASASAVSGTPAAVPSPALAPGAEHTP